MPAKTTVTLTGFKELAENLRGIDEKMRTRIGYRAVARVMRRTKEDAIRNAYSAGLLDSGALIRNIAIARISSGGSSLSFIYDAGVRHGTKKQIKQTKAAGKNVNDPWYWFLHEFGYTHRGGGQVGPTPFLTPAFQARMTDGVDLMGDTLWKGIEAANKPNKK